MNTNDLNNLSHPNWDALELKSDDDIDYSEYSIIKR